MPLHKTQVQVLEPGDRMWPRKNYIDPDRNEKSQMAPRLIVMKLAFGSEPQDAHVKGLCANPSPVQIAGADLPGVFLVSAWCVGQGHHAAWRDECFVRP
jgi:hypothetical protein